MGKYGRKDASAIDDATEEDVGAPTETYALPDAFDIAEAMGDDPVVEDAGEPMEIDSHPDASDIDEAMVNGVHDEMEGGPAEEDAVGPLETDAVPKQDRAPVEEVDTELVGGEDTGDVTTELETANEEENAPVAMEDRSFDLNGRDFARPPAHLDVSLQERSIDPVVPAESPLTFEVIEGGSKRGGRKLVKKVALQNIFRPVGDIVETVMKELTIADDFQLPKPVKSPSSGASPERAS